MVNPVFSHGETAGQVLPYFDEVTRIMAPLEYSGIHNILENDSRLSVDFEKKTWTLHNVFDFNDDGSDILIDGKRGLCVRLARYVYHQIRGIFPADRYEIFFEKVKERDYFFAPQATHILLTVLDKESSTMYLIDPSFKRYGRVDDFDEYVFFERMDPKVFLESNKSSDKFFNVDSASPIFIRDGRLLVFAVEFVDGEIGPDRFVVSISAVERRADKGEYVLGLKYFDGYIQTYSNDRLMRRLLTPDEITKIQQRLLQWSVLISRSRAS